MDLGEYKEVYCYLFCLSDDLETLVNPRLSSAMSFENASSMSNSDWLFSSDIASY